jgi:hypothetical protein
MMPAVRVTPVFLVVTAAAALSGCGAPQPPVNAGISCASYGGCDVLEDFADGHSTIVQLRTNTYFDADSRARQDSLRSDVVDASVVGHNPPHIALSNLYYHVRHS